jgi:hypothetical protein
MRINGQPDSLALSAARPMILAGIRILFESVLVFGTGS